MKIMDKVKSFSEIVCFNDITILYFNALWPAESEKDRINNNKIRKEFEIVLKNFVEQEPLFSKIERNSENKLTFFDSKNKEIKILKESSFNNKI